MRSAFVVLDDPGVELGLRRRHAGERPIGAELGAQRAMEALDLAGRGRRPGLGQAVRDPVLPAHPIEQHLYRRLVEATREHLAVIGQDLLRDPEAAHRQRQPGAHLTRRLTRHQKRRHAAPGMIIDPGQRIHPGAVGEHEPADHRTSATTPLPLRVPNVATYGPADASPPGRSGSTAANSDTPPTPTAPVRRRVWRARTPAAADPTTDAPAASPAIATSTAAGI